MLDILLGISFAYTLYQGYKKGILYQICSLIALGLGIYLAGKFSTIVATYLIENGWYSGHYVGIIAFILIVIGVLFGVYTLRKSIEKIMKLTGLHFLNKLGGVLFAALKLILILVLVFRYFLPLNETLQLVNKESLEQSVIFTTVIRPFIF